MGLRGSKIVVLVEKRKILSFREEKVRSRRRDCRSGIKLRENLPLRVFKEPKLRKIEIFVAKREKSKKITVKQNKLSDTKIVN